MISATVNSARPEAPTAELKTCPQVVPPLTCSNTIEAPAHPEDHSDPSSSARGEVQVKVPAEAAQLQIAIPAEPEQRFADLAKLPSSGRLNSVGQVTLKVQLKWENVVVVPKDQMKMGNGCMRGKSQTAGANPAQPPPEARKILDGINGIVKPCEFLAIIGASGAGKTTLLNYLSNKMFPADLHASGRTTINGIERENLDYFKFTAFVQQDDILFETLTVQGMPLFLTLPDRGARVRCRPEMQPGSSGAGSQGAGDAF